MRVPTIWGFSLDFIVVVVAIAGVLSAMVVLQFTGSGHNHPAWLPDLLSQLQTVRMQIELYNSEHPETPYDATTPVGPAFWDPLLQNGYLVTVPRNPAQNKSSLVVASPREGAGWVWAEGLPGDPWTLSIYAIDAKGKLLDWDEDGRPD